MYADDTVCYLSDPLLSIKELVTLLRSFGSVSGYKINQEKSILTGLNIVGKVRKEVSKIWPGKRQENNIRYLGVRIGITNQEMIYVNIIPLIIYVKEKCTKWALYPLSWLGRIAVTKMVLLPKILFLFLNIILKVPINLLRKIQGIINNIIWKGNRPRVHA